MRVGVHAAASYSCIVLQQLRIQAVAYCYGAVRRKLY
jgi:hypothetical protein